MMSNATIPYALVLCATLGAGVAYAHSHGSAHDAHDDVQRQHGSHVHGISQLNIALDGKELHVELDSPAANIVGFEHLPASPAEHGALNRAMNRLRDGEHLFRFSAAASCQLQHSTIESAIIPADYVHHEPAHEHIGDAEVAAEAGHDHAAEHRHSSPGEQHAHHEPAPGQQHTTADAETGHADMRVEYHFVCSAPEKLERVDVRFFEAFRLTERLDVQFVIGDRQGAAQLNPQAPGLKF